MKTDCSLNLKIHHKKTTISVHVVYIIVYMLYTSNCSEWKKNVYSTCTELIQSVYVSYYGLIDARMSASDKE